MLRASGIRKAFAARTLLDGVDLHVHPGDRIGLVGRNGEGKTTLLRILAGTEPCDDGRVVLRKGARIGYLRQEIDPTSQRAVIDEVRTVQAHVHALEARMRALEAEIAERGAAGKAVSEALAHRYDEATHAFEAAGGYEAEAELRGTLVGLGIGPDRWQWPLAKLSGGWVMRVELAKLLLARPDVLLLDEPTNHLDLPSIQWFEGVLQTYPGSVVVVSHDRVFLDRHATRIAELEHARLTDYKGNYSEYLAQKAQRERESRARQANLDKQIQHAQKFVDRFGAKASKATQAESRKKKIALLKSERDGLGVPQEKRKLRFRFPPVPRSGQIVLRLEGVDKSYGELCVYKGLDLEIQRGQRIALVGPNGAGKSTLLRAAAGVLPIDTGTREPGHNVATAFYAQHQLEALHPTNTVLEEVESVAPLDQIPRLRNLLGTFLFSGDDVQKKVSVLSGGEKARVALAKLLLGSANFLILDEPTNHLDLQAREVLSHALAEYEGTLLFISHDRSFINELANRVVEVTRDPDAEAARVRAFPGSFDDYVERVRAEGAPPATSAEKQRATEAKLKPDRARAKRLRELRARLGEVESAVDAGEKEIERLGWLAAEPEAAKDGARQRELELARRAEQEKLDALYGEWEALSAQVEALED